MRKFKYKKIYIVLILILAFISKYYIPKNIKTELGTSLLTRSFVLDSKGQKNVLDNEKDRGKKELRVCSQNLYNYNPFSSKRDYQGYALAKRISQKECDVIALQEVLGKDKRSSLKILNKLASLLKKLSGDSYSAYVGSSNDFRIRNGFLVSNKVLTVKNSWTFSDTPLTRVDKFSPGRHFIRGPFALELELKDNSNSIHFKRIILLSFHFKSKWNAYKDPSKSDFEFSRMQSSESLRKIVEELKEKAKESRVILALGDRNSESNSASSSILSGRNILDDFINKDSKLCKTSYKLKTLCKPDYKRKIRLVDLFSYRHRKFGNKYKVWSLRFRKKGMLYDEVYIPLKDLWIASNKDGIPSVGITNKPKKASDHSLLWVDLNW